MSSLTGRGERFPSTIRGVHLRSLVPHHFASGGFSADTDGSRGAQPGEERPAPEGAGGSRGDPHRNMCQRADDVPGYKSLPGSVGDRIRSTMSFGGGTLCRGSNAGCGRSDRKVACCEKCSASLVALKKQALSLAVHHHFSCKDFSDLSLYLHDNLRVHGRDREQGECGSCGRTLNQLKQEAIHLALSRGQSLAKPPFEAGLLGHNESKHGERAPGEAAAATAAAHLPRSQTYSPHSPRSPRTPQRTPQTLRRRGAKTPIQDMDRWVEEQQQLVASKYATSTDGVTGYAFHKQAADDATQSCGDVGTLQTSSKIPHISRVVNIANTAAMSFLSRAAEKLNLTLRKKGQASHPAPSNLSSCFREIVQKSPPPVPPCLLQAATRTKDSPNVAKVKVVLRVHPAPSEAQCYPSILRIDPSKKRVTVMEPIAKNQPYTAMTLGRDGKSLLKTFNFDAAYPQESSQAEVGAGVLADVIRCVLSGSDGCVLGLGCADVGSWSSMVGSGESVHKLGVMPCAISWLYSAIERRREKTWTDLTVSVSAMELCCGDEDTLRDLLGEVVPSSGGVQDSPKAHVRIQEDPVSGIQLRNHNRVKAPTAERAASLLDAAIAARRHSDFVTYLSHSSVMFFTLHVQPPRTESSTIGKGSRGSTKLTLIDVCSGMRGMSKNKPPHAELGPIVLSLLHGNKTTPSKGSKLTMLLRESLSHSNCHIAVMADVSDSLAHLQETFATIQLASRIRRTQKRTKQSTSCSPCGRSLTREKRGPQPLSLRAFHSTDEVDVDTCPFRLRSELDERSSSDQSCDTVIQIDLDGLIHPKGVPRLTQPEFVPIIPSLHPNKADLEDPEFTALLQELLRIPQLQGEKKTEDTGPGLTDSLNAARKPPERDCLKCDTFAELQERLGCIDGSEITIDLLKSSLQGASYDIVSTKLQHPRDARTQGPAEAPEAAQTLNQGSGCTQASARDKPTDGTFPGDSFQREDSGLYDCEECSANSSSEELLNQTLGLNMACRQEPPHTATSKSGQARHFGMDAARTVSPGAFANHLSEKQENPDGVDWFKPDKRASPIGKSSPISPSSYCTSSHSLAKSVVLSDVLHNRHTQDVKEVKATITVTVQQPLDLKGQDELVFSMVEEVTISGAYERGSTGGNIICIRDAAQSKAQDSTGSQPIRIISNVGEESVAPSSSNTTDSSAQETKATETNTENPKYQSRRERGFVPSFINHMLINTDVESELDGAKAKESLHKTPVGGKSGPEDRRNVDRLQNGRLPEKRSGDLPLDTHRSDKSCCSSNAQVVYNSSIVDDSSLCSKPPKNKMCEKRPQNTGKVHLRDTEHVYAINAPRVPEGGLMVCRHGGSTLRRTGVPPGCLETALASSQTGSLPRGWQNANSGCHVTNAHRASRGVTSSTPCSPGATLERRQGRVHPPANHTLHISSPRKYGSEFKQESSPAPRRGVGSLFETSSLTMKRENAGGRMKSPGEDSGKLFSAKLEQLATRTNSLGRIPRDFPAMERGSSNTSMSSKGSVEGACKPRYKGHNEGECTFPRASRSPRKSHRSDHHFFPSEKPVTHSTRHNHSKLSAVGKLKISTPKVRRLSAPSMKNLSLSHKNLQQSINRSASLSPDGKTISFERTSSFFSSSTSSPPRSFHSVSRTPSQSSTCSSTKSVIQSFVNGRISDLLKERAPSPPSGGGLDHVASLPSPYSQVTAPRMPDRMSGHASDTTSVLSGDLPPAMGKTSLHFSNRSSLVSSGYGSMVRDSEASNRDSVSDRSGSQLSVARSSRSSSRRRGNSGTHQRRPSHDTSASMRRSSSGLRSRWMDRGIPEAYELKVYEIDNLQRMQKRAGADKQGSARFSAKLKLLEHRQQRIAEVRDKYSTLRGALEGAKHHLMLGPTKWNHEFDLWQTFEVDSLEHLEALEGVTARLESRVNRCKANVMMVTCFDAAARRRRKRRSRRAPERRVPEEL